MDAIHLTPGQAILSRGWNRRGRPGHSLRAGAIGEQYVNARRADGLADAEIPAAARADAVAAWPCIPPTERERFADWAVGLASAALERLAGRDLPAAT